MQTSISSAILLLALGTACARSPEEWRTGLRDTDPFASGMCALALARVDPQGCEPALPRLLELVDGADPDLRRAARAALLEVAPAQVTFLLQQYVSVEDASPDFRSALRAALVAAGPRAVEPLRAHLFERGASNPRALGQILADIGASAVGPLTDDLGDANAQRRATAAWILGRIGRPAEAAAPALRRMLERDTAALARQAALALAEIAPLDEATRAALERRAPETREALAHLALQRAGLGIVEETQARLFALGLDSFVPAVEACEAREAALREAGARRVRACFAALALGLEPRGLECTRDPARLQSALDDRDGGTRALAALEIAARGARSAAFLGALAARVRDPQPGVAWSAQLALLHVLRCMALEARR